MCTHFGFGALSRVFFALLAIAGLGAARAQSVTIDSDAMTIAGDDDFSGQFFGVPFTTSVVNGIATFYVAGDLVIPANAAISFMGTRPASVVVANHLALSSGVSFNASASGRTPGMGGGQGSPGGTGQGTSNASAGNAGGRGSDAVRGAG